MKDETPELQFADRAAFRAWLGENAQTSGGVWLLFGKTKALVTLSASDALEEALCFGWIDGQMKSIDGSKYRKYFAPRRPKSVWSDKNKKLVETLRAKRLMTALGEQAIETAQKNGIWDARPVGDEEIEALAAKLAGISPAYENFMKMPPSGKLMTTRRYLSTKGEATRQRDFLLIVDDLNKM